MFAKILQSITGMDDLERVAAKEDLPALNAYLKTRHVFVPIRPRRFLDVDSSQEQLLDLVAKGTQDMAGNEFEIWVLEVDGKKRLPVFSSQKKMEAFQGELSKKLNKIFALGALEILVENAIKGTAVDVIDLNLYSKKSWEIEVRPPE